MFGTIAIAYTGIGTNTVDGTYRAFLVLRTILFTKLHFPYHFFGIVFSFTHIDKNPFVIRVQRVPRRFYFLCPFDHLGIT
ncbi:hypothetical protein D3C87_1907610 [compost metagenome]